MKREVKERKEVEKINIKKKKLIDEQGGDCAERFMDCNKNSIEVLIYSLLTPYIFFYSIHSLISFLFFFPYFFSSSSHLSFI